jgi:hypothetical protein
MGNRIGTRIVLGSLRYKSAPDTELGLKVPFIQSGKNMIEFDRSVDISLAQVFDDERQKSNIIRPTGKFMVLFENSIAGKTTYVPFRDNLYYINALQSALDTCNGGSNVEWSGLPQYNEFDFIRTDNNVEGYTKSPGEHLIFSPKKAANYNWNFYVSYAFENVTNKNLQAYDSTTNTSLTWIVSDGIPFIINNSTSNGLNVVSFRCPVKHGLTVGEYIKLSFSYTSSVGTTDTFQVYSLGNGKSGTEEFIINIVNPGFIGSTFNNGTTGTLKRIINNENPTDTISSYYIRKHKIISEVDNNVLVKAGFENNIFGNVKKFQSAALTPNNIARIATKEGAQSYTLTFNQDFDISPLLDNQKRPLTELYITVIFKGYFGWFFGKPKPGGGYYGLKHGYEFNLPLDLVTPNTPNTWWEYTNSDSDLNIPLSVYNTTLGGPINFTYVDTLLSGDTIDGEICEWNEYEQIERIVSYNYHKFTFNENVFDVINTPPSNPYGYYYKPHHEIPIRVFSDYLEEGDSKNIVGIPDYSYFSTTKNTFIWRDLYPFGYVDSTGLGIDFPFMNGTHYPFKDIIFRIIPEGTNYIEQTTVADPLIDDCE